MSVAARAIVSRFDIRGVVGWAVGGPFASRHWYVGHSVRADLHFPTAHGRLVTDRCHSAKPERRSTQQGYRSDIPGETARLTPSAKWSKSEFISLRESLLRRTFAQFDGEQLARSNAGSISSMRWKSLSILRTIHVGLCRGRDAPAFALLVNFVARPMCP